MTISQEHHLTYKLNSDFHRIALDFASQQETTTKGKEVYLNTLAVCAVKNFIEELSFETSLEKSDSWDPVIRCFRNAADIVVSELGRVECLSTIEDTDFVSIPKEVREGRIAYIVIRFPEVLNELELLGFYRCSNLAIDTDKIQIKELEPIENLIDYLFDLELELERQQEQIEIGTNFLASDDEVAIRVRQRLSSESYEEITRQFKHLFDNVEEEDWRFQGAKIFKNLMGIKENDLVALDRSGVLDDDDLDFELEELTEDLLDKFKIFWSDDDLDINGANNSNSETILPKFSIIDSLKIVRSQVIDAANKKLDELAEQTSWLWVDYQPIGAGKTVRGSRTRKKTPKGYFKQDLTIEGEQYQLRIKPVDVDLTDLSNKNEWTFELRTVEPGGIIPPGYKLRLLDENGEANERVAGEGEIALLFEGVEFEAGDGMIVEIEPIPKNYCKKIIYFDSLNT